MGDARPTCAHNPASGREKYWPQIIKESENKGKKVVVIGGGPAGMDAARICAERGHDVILFEAADDLGGQLRMASKASWRNDISNVIDWRKNELDILKVDVRLNQYIEAEDVLAQNPDIVIVATGGVPDLNWLKGNDLCTSVWDLLTGNVAVEENVIIYDGTGRHPGLIAADYCYQANSDIQLVLLDDRPGAELAYGERVIWKRQLAQSDILPLFDYKLIDITRQDDYLQGDFVHELTGESKMLSAKQIIVEHGTTPADDLYYALRSHASNDGVTDTSHFLAGEAQSSNSEKGGFELHRIGDALSSRDMAAAVFDALRLCSTM